jgi:protein SCO1/2
MIQTAQLSIFFSKLVQRKFFWVVLVGFSFFTPIYRSVVRPLPAAPEVLFHINDFKLIDENGKEFESAMLNKKYSILFFHFSKCPSICPKMMETAQKIEKRVRGLGQHVAILAVSVDPLNDTPQELFNLARKLHANPYVWSFLTGSQAQVENLLNSFKQPSAQMNANLSPMDVVHSGSYFIFDKNLNVRGIYQNNIAEINRMMIDLGLMINRT